MEVRSLVDHCVNETTLQQPEAYLASIPPHWTKARLALGEFGQQLRLTHTSL